MPDNTVTYQITGVYDGSAASQAAQGIAGVGTAADTAGKKAAESAGAGGFGKLSEVFSFGLGAGLAEKGLDLVVSGLERVKEAFVDTIKEAVHLNAELETQTLGLAATLRSVEPEKYLSFEAAKNGATEAINLIRARAVELGQDSHGIIEAYSANLSALAEAGVADTGKQVQLVTALMAAAASKGISGVQALRDSIDILNGRAGNIVLAKELGLENSALKEAAANGTTYQLIMGKLVGYNEGLGAQAQSFQGISNRVSELVRQIEQDFGAQLFDAAREGLNRIAEILSDPRLKDNAADIGKAFGDVGKAVSFAAVDIAQGVSATADEAARLASVFHAIVQPNADLDATLNARLETNRKLIDQSVTQDQQAIARRSIIKQLADAEHDLQEARRRPADDGTEALFERQKFLLQDQLNFFDQAKGKRDLIAAAGERERALNEEQKTQLRDLVAALEQRRQAAESIAERERYAADYQAEQLARVRDVVSQYGILTTGLSTANEFLAASATLTERQRLAVLPYVDGLARAEDSQRKITAELGKQKLAVDQFISKQLADEKKQLADIDAEIAKTNANEAGGREKVNALLEKKRLLALDIANLEKVAAAQILADVPALTAMIDDIKARLAGIGLTGTPENADARGGLNRAAAGLGNLAGGAAAVPILGPGLLAALDAMAQAQNNAPPSLGIDAAAPASPVRNPSAIADFGGGPPAGNPTERFYGQPYSPGGAEGDTLPASAKSIADGGAATQEGAQKIAEAAEGVRTAGEDIRASAGGFAGAVTEGLGSAAGAFGEHAAALPGKFEPLLAAQAEYHAAVAEGFDSLGNNQLVLATGLQRQITALETRLDNVANSY